MLCNKSSFKSGRRGGGNDFNGSSKEGRRPKIPQCGNGPNPHYPLNSFSCYAQLLLNCGRAIQQHFKVGFSFRIYCLRGLCKSVDLSVLLHQENK